MLILLRHATPVIDYKRCDYKAARDRIHQYNTTHQIQTIEIDDYIEEFANKFFSNRRMLVFSSGMPRAKITAEYVFKNLKVDIMHNSIFSEFELDILKVPLLKLRTKTWFLISRIAWFFGISGKAKPFSNEKARAINAAKILENHMKDDNLVVLIGHGLMNKFIENYFKKNNFEVKQEYKNGCFSVKTFEKKLIFDIR